MRLSLKSPKYPAKDMNIVIGDFFKIKPAQSVLLPHRTVGGKEEYRSVIFSNFEAIIGNPPYTRWNDLSKEERRTIRDEIGKVLNEYHLTQKREEPPPLFVHWIVHAERFLKDHGKLGMIISNMWLRQIMVKTRQVSARPFQDKGFN